MDYVDFSFMVNFSSYSVKSHDFIIIFDLIVPILCTSMMIVGFTIQLLSIVTEKRGGRRRAKHHCTGINGNAQ